MTSGAESDLFDESEGTGRAGNTIASPRTRIRCSFTYLHLAASRECTDALVAANNVAIAYETVRLRDNSLPLLTPMSEVAGRMAPLMAAHHLMRPGGGHGTLISGVPGVAPGQRRRDRRRCLGTRGRDDGRRLTREREDPGTAISSGLRQVDIHFDGRVADDCVLDPRARRRLSRRRHRHRCRVGRRSQGAQTREQRNRGRGCDPVRCWVDISVDQGGCFEATHPTTHSDPVFEVNGSIFYCVREHAGAFPLHVDLRARQRHVALRDGTRGVTVGARPWWPTTHSPKASTWSKVPSPTDRWPNPSAWPSVHYARCCNRRRPDRRCGRIRDSCF